jgi:hypothetical protein
MSETIRSIGDFYTTLIDQFLTGAIPVDVFCDTYLRRFKAEQTPLGEPLYDILNDLFGDIDCYTTDPTLLASDPDFYLDEPRLRERASESLRQLHAMAD